MRSFIEPTMNDVPISAYKASILSYSIGSCSYDNGYFLPVGTMIPVKLKHTLGLRPITITIDFEGETEHSIAENIIAFTKELHEGAEILLSDGFTYKCYYKKASDPSVKAPWIRQVKFSLEGYRHGSIEKKSIHATATGTFSMFVEGDCTTPAVIKISTEAETITVLGVTIDNITGDITIDGYNKTIKQEGQNHFADSDLTEFPSLEPGLNSISVSLPVGTVNDEIEADIEISYYPLYR